MTDYECPSCDGGFPAPADECPWCGESMDSDGDGADPGLTPSVPPLQAPVPPFEPRRERGTTRPRNLDDEDLFPPGSAFQTASDLRGTGGSSRGGL